MIRELLSFQPSLSRAIPTGAPRHFQKPHFPSHSVQIQRIGPKLQSLSDAMNRQTMIIQQSTQGIDPEFVLVFEVANSVDEFMRAAQKANMEWLIGMDSQIEADEEFYSIRKDGSPSLSEVASKLYLTMTNQRAMQQLLSLWRIYRDGVENYPTGMTPFRDVFSQLKDVRRWSVKDRFEDTGVINVWRNVLQHSPEIIRFEIELWYRKNVEKRDEAQNEVLRILHQYGGSLVRTSIYEEIGFHGLIVECPSKEIQQMIDNSNHDLINAEPIMAIRAVGQALAISNVAESDEQFRYNASPLPNKVPVVALLDGVPVANHTLLQGRIDLDDPDNLESSYQAGQRIHGTSMASLIIHGDLNNGLPALDSYLYIRPILKPNSFGDETVPEDRFFVDVLHEAIKEIGENPRLSSIRIVNISIGNPDRPFVNSISPEAKMLDWLSEKYNLLIIVSSGNCPQNIFLPMLYGEYKMLSDKQKLKAIYDYLWQNQYLMKIYSPSECINGICVGATHDDFSALSPAIPMHNPIPNGYPAIYSCFGGGYQGAVKPDIVMSGGRQLFSVIDFDSQPAILRVNRQCSTRVPGQFVASGKSGLNSIISIRGTSNAAALTSRLCADFLDVVRNSHNVFIPAEYEAIALKTMLVHSSSWNEMGQELMNEYVPKIPRKLRHETLKWIGYGIPNPEKSSFCTDQRVTLIGYGQLKQGMMSEFKFPLPSCLISQAVKKRLTISLSWLSPIAPLNKNYRLAKLFFDANTEEVVVNNEDVDDKTARRGTIQHEVFVGSQAATYIDGTDLLINVSCKKEPDLMVPVKYVLMATLEVAEETGLPIYQQVAARVQTQIGVEN